MVLGPRQNTGLKLGILRSAPKNPIPVFSFTFLFFFFFISPGIWDHPGFFGDFRLVDVFFPVVNGLRHTFFNCCVHYIVSSMYLDTWAVVGFSSKRSVTKCQRASVLSVSLKVWSLRSKSPVKTLNRPRRGWCLRPVQGTLHWARYAAAVARHLCAPASCLALAGYSVSWRGTQALHSSELV